MCSEALMASMSNWSHLEGCYRDASTCPPPLCTSWNTSLSEERGRRCTALNPCSLNVKLGELVTQVSRQSMKSFIISYEVKWEMIRSTELMDRSKSKKVLIIFTMLAIFREFLFFWRFISIISRFISSIRSFMNNCSSKISLILSFLL